MGESQREGGNDCLTRRISPFRPESGGLLPGSYLSRRCARGHLAGRQPLHLDLAEVHELARVLNLESHNPAISVIVHHYVRSDLISIRSRTVSQVNGIACPSLGSSEASWLVLLE